MQTAPIRPGTEVQLDNAASQDTAQALCIFYGPTTKPRAEGASRARTAPETEVTATCGRWPTRLLLFHVRQDEETNDGACDLESKQGTRAWAGTSFVNRRRRIHELIAR